MHQPEPKIQATVLTLEEIQKRQYPIPDIWRRVAGILEGRDTIDPVEYQHMIRAEWEVRLSKQFELSSPHHAD